MNAENSQVFSATIKRYGDVWLPNMDSKMTPEILEDMISGLSKALEMVNEDISPSLIRERKHEDLLKEILDNANYVASDDAWTLYLDGYNKKRLHSGECVYFMTEINQSGIKVGYSKDLRKRFMMYGGSAYGENPDKRVKFFIQTSHAKRLERLIHSMLGKRYYRGGKSEYFNSEIVIAWVHEYTPIRFQESSS